MKILIIQENGRHDENRNFRECFSIQRAFIKNGHDAEVWGLGHKNYQDNVDFNNFDIIFNLENYGDHWLPDISNVKKPLKLLWSIDAHFRGANAYENIFNRGKYDYLLHSTKDYVNSKHHIWFPNSYDDDLIFPMNIEKKHKVGFVGNWANRKQILEYLRDKYSMHLDIFVIGNKMVEAINSYQCHFNLNISNDINYRSFETIGCGTLLLTNYNPVYEEMGFKDHHNCLMYTSIDDLETKIKNLDVINVEKISSNGLELAKEHTYFKRVENLLKDLSL
jgi:spore maturation protein CgeB